MIGRIAALAACIQLASVSAEQVFLEHVLPTDNGAVCLDGSPAVVYVNKPVTPPPSPKIILFLQGGGWCFDTTLNETLDNCVKRSRTDRGSSKSYGPTFTPSYEGGDGLLSNDSAINPTFSDGFTYIYARYCDGASFAGNVDLVNNETGTPLYFRGHRILEEIFTYLEEDLGLGQASEALLAGCSAGGLATYIHCDEFAAYAQAAALRAGRSSSDVKTRCIADAGYFPDFVAQPINQPILRTQYHWVTVLQNTTLHTNQQCIDASGSEAWQCFFPQYTAPHLKTPIFAVNSGYDSWQTKADWFAEAEPNSAWYNCSMNLEACQGEQLATLQSFHKEYVTQTLTPILSPTSPHGAFIDSCYEHCQSGATWSEGATIRGTHIGEAVSAWYTGASTGAASKTVMAPYGESEAGSACN